MIHANGHKFIPSHGGGGGGGGVCVCLCVCVCVLINSVTSAILRNP